MTYRSNDDLIEIERRCFMGTSNPMHVWAAYQFARAARSPLPEWVMTYLDLCSRRLFAIDSSEVKESDAMVASAFLMKKGKGAGTVISQYRKSKVLVYGMNVHDRIKAGMKPDFAVAAVAEIAGVSISTVHRAWKQYDAMFPDGDETALIAAGS